MAINALLRFAPWLLAAIIAPQAFPVDHAGIAKAREAWEEAIRAKGGRERLRSVSNVVLSSTSHWGIKGFNRTSMSYETLLVLPSKMWDYSDQRPSKFGVELMIVDLDQGYHQLISQDSPGPLPRGKPNVGDIRQIRETQILTFMETRWLQPEVLRAEDKLWNIRRVTVVETEFGEQRLDFYLDRRTRLPLRVLIKTPTAYGIHETDCRLGEYASVAGLQLPHDVACKVQGRRAPLQQSIRYQLNVKYDEEIFDRPPSLDRGAKGWQPRAAEKAQSAEVSTPPPPR